ncbi:MAG: glycogen/starch/alpha-glucan phosphorylase [Carboxydocellales bacterium]
MFTDKESLKKAFIGKLTDMYGKNLVDATPQDKYQVLGSLVKELINRNWISNSAKCNIRNDAKQVYYFSMEFMLGRLLGNNLLNLDWLELWAEALAELGLDLNELEKTESDAGLGNGGLGRLAACFLDSLASLNLPGHGCGIRYKYGLFEQKIVNGYQVELPENWLKEGNVWETRKPDKSVIVKLNGTVRVEEIDGKINFIHEDYDPVLAVPYDMPIIGYRNEKINNLRLWNAEAAKSDFDFASFNRGEHLKAVEYKYEVESISQVLYPDDQNYLGRELRLKQQYFFVSAGVQSIIRHFKKQMLQCGSSWKDLPQMVAIHVNDTHPVLAIPELMRILLDEAGLGWDEAWLITTSTVSYTNHTIMAEALEKWPVEMVKSLLPRIYMIIEEINERFCRDLWNKYPGEWDKIHAMAIIADSYVKMAHLAVVGSYSVNGVAKMHSDILKKKEMKDFYEFYPYKFNNKTNGITHRRWLIKANPKLAKLISEAIGTAWIKHPSELVGLQKYAQDTGFQEKVAQIKLENKVKLAAYVQEKYGVTLDVHSIFDTQVKRMHAYKRQLLNILQIIDLYNRLQANPDLEVIPRTFIFGGKAAPGYFHAKSIIKLINTLADKINNDRSIQDKLKVVFMENYQVSLAELIIPAADISEQISTASKEASGTGNMKFMLNGALTLGTRDGANVEIGEAVGEDNIFFFGLNSEEVMNYYKNGGYNARKLYSEDEGIKRVVSHLNDGFLGVGREEFSNIYQGLLSHNDEYFVLKDFNSYVAAQNKVNTVFGERQHWMSMSINNIAQAGRFSSDRTIAEYATGIWKISEI